MDTPKNRLTISGNGYKGWRAILSTSILSKVRLFLGVSIFFSAILYHEEFEVLKVLLQVKERWLVYFTSSFEIINNTLYFAKSKFYL